MKTIHALCFERINLRLTKLFVLLLFLLSSEAVLAQEAAPSEAKFQLGLQATPSFVWLKAKEPLPPALDGDGSKLGFAFGLMAEFNFAKNYSFATGVDVSYRGGYLKSETKTTSPGNPKSDSVHVISTNSSLEYVEIPLTLKMKTNQIGNFTYFGQFGVAPGINISSKAEVHTQTQYVDSLGHGGAVVTKDDNDKDIKDDINNFNLSLVIGLGLEYSLGGNTKAIAAITFNNGFLDVLDASDFKAISNCLGLKIGVLF